MVIVRQTAPSFQKNYEERPAATISRNPARAYLARALWIFYKIAIFPLLSALSPGEHRCRFYPTCSCYAQECLTEFGFCKATFYIIKRILKCSPFYRGYEYFDFPISKDLQRKRSQ